MMRRNPEIPDLSGGLVPEPNWPWPAGPLPTYPIEPPFFPEPGTTWAPVPPPPPRTPAERTASWAANPDVQAVAALVGVLTVGAAVYLFWNFEKGR
jgi:hypothetical protein